MDHTKIILAQSLAFLSVGNQDFQFFYICLLILLVMGLLEPISATVKQK